MVTARSFEAHGTSKRTYKIMLKVRAKCWECFLNYS